MNISNHELLIAASILSLFLFSRQILRLCLGLFVSVSSIILAIVAIVCCTLLIFIVAAPTLFLTCYVVGQVADGKPTNSRLIESVCNAEGSHKHNVSTSRKY